MRTEAVAALSRKSCVKMIRHTVLVLVFLNIWTVLHCLSENRKNKWVGHYCRLPDELNDLGKCRHFSDCQIAKCGYKHGVSLKGCEGGLVCCDERKRLSELACSRYEDMNTFNRVEGGTAVKDPHMYGYMAALGFERRSHNHRDTLDLHWLCGGVLISERYVLTVAHCATDPYNGELKKVKVHTLLPYKDEPIEKPNETNPNSSYEFDVEEIIVHDGFEPPAKYDDIALIRLVQYINFNIFKYIIPPCINNRPVRTEQIIIALGWGTPFHTEDTPLQQGIFTLLDKEECVTHFENDTIQLPRRFNSNKMLCVGNKTINVDTCQRDSGGPLLIENDDKYILIGMTSFGNDPCGGRRPSVYTNVTHYLDWIECIVWPDETGEEQIHGWHL